MNQAQSLRDTPDELIVASIQPAGYLVATDLKCEKIAAASSNLAELLGMDVETALGAKSALIFDNEDLHEIRNALGHASARSTRIPLSVKSISDRDYQVLIHRHDDHAVIELVRERTKSRKRAAMLRLAYSYFDTKLEPHGLFGFFSEVVEHMRATLDFHRVGVVQCQKGRLSETMAEARYPGIDPRKPRSDRDGPRIPSEVRAIADQTDQGLNVFGEVPINLDRALLASPNTTEVHAMEHSGMKATFTAPIRIDGTTWGAILCESTDARAFDPTLVATLDLASKIVSQRVQHVLELEELGPPEGERS